MSNADWIIGWIAIGVLMGLGFIAGGEHGRF